MKASIITTAYNHQDTIERAINSANAQTFKDYEHIIIDDTEINNGMMRTYYEAFKRCKGDYIFMLDADDYWIDADKLAKQVRFMDDNPQFGLCITKVYTEIDGKRYPMKASAEEVNKNMSYDNLIKGSANIYAQGYCIRRSDFEKYAPFEAMLHFSVWDYPIVLELIRHTRFHCLDFYSAVYTKNAESVTNTRSRKTRFKYVMGNYNIKLTFILMYGCKVSTFLYLIYKFMRDIYSIAFLRW